jgi:hypothetical protein
VPGFQKDAPQVVVDPRMRSLIKLLEERKLIEYAISPTMPTLPPGAAPTNRPTTDGLGLDSPRASTASGAGGVNRWDGRSDHSLGNAERKNPSHHSLGRPNGRSSDSSDSLRLQRVA